MKKLIIIVMSFILNIISLFCMKKQNQLIPINTIQAIRKHIDYFYETHKHMRKNKALFEALFNIFLDSSGYTNDELTQTLDYAKYSDSQHKLAKSFIKKKLPEQAIRILEKLSHTYNDYEAQFELALLYFKRGDYVLSKYYAIKALENGHPKTKVLGQILKIIYRRIIYQRLPTLNKPKALFFSKNT